GDRGGTPGRREDQWFLRAGSGPSAHPRHAAPRPHNARFSVRCTYPTSVDLGSNATAVSMGIPRLGAAPGMKLYRELTHPPAKVYIRTSVNRCCRLGVRP